MYRDWPSPQIVGKPYDSAVRTGLIAALAAGLWLVCPGAAKAGELAVDAAGCEGLDAERLSMLLRIEVAPVLEANPQMPDLAVAVTCEGEQMRLAVRDPVTDKRLERAMPAPQPADPERERVVALAAAQLFRASWAELIAAPAEEAESVAAPDPETPEARAAVEVIEQESRETRGPHELSLHALVRWRDLGAPVLMNHGGLRYGYRLPRGFLVWGEAMGGFGRASRRLGFVNVVDVIGALGAGWRSPPFGPFTFDVELGGAAVYERLSGKSAAGGIDEGVIWALTGELVGAVALTLHARWLLTSLAAEGGFMFAGPRGAVSNEADVDPDGAWLGVGLRVGGAIRGGR